MELSMESQPQNPEFRNNPENFHPYILSNTEHLLNIYLLVLSADNLCKPFGPRSGPTF